MALGVYQCLLRCCLPCLQQLLQHLTLDPVHAGGSISQHYLGGYQRALLAICLAQFSAKRYKEGMQGVMALALAAQPLQALFDQELDLTPADMQDLAR